MPPHPQQRQQAESPTQLLHLQPLSELTVPLGPSKGAAAQQGPLGGEAASDPFAMSVGMLELDGHKDVRRLSKHLQFCQTK